MAGGKSGQGIWFDPRTKIGLLLLCILSAATAPSLAYELGLVALVAVYGLFCGKRRYALIGLLAYAVGFLLTLAALGYTKGTTRTTLMAFLGLVHKVYPCGFLSGIMISTTKVSEFLTAMNRMRVPKTLVIPLAVMLRYLPAIQEDWRFIKDAMRLRDVYPSFLGLLTHPAMTVECLYVPLMMSASKAADELSIASVTRGIENPMPRTCLVQIRFGPADILAGVCFLAYLSAGRLLFV
ncbi:MAG: energy-coupling factor transporter transmembrane protein EcfT [Spirochaetaceae bacterium]|jgi:energy-coupling factor transport system permease protein|nr:energy-coupling factor transporter transmembrane protein EcfT [Spirochaetaceae bacterium]